MFYYIVCYTDNNINILCLSQATLVLINFQHKTRVASERHGTNVVIDINSLQTSSLHFIMCKMAASRWNAEKESITANVTSNFHCGVRNSSSSSTKEIVIEWKEGEGREYTVIISQAYKCCVVTSILTPLNRVLRTVPGIMHPCYR